MAPLPDFDMGAKGGGRRKRRRGKEEIYDTYKAVRVRSSDGHNHHELHR